MWAVENRYDPFLKRLLVQSNLDPDKVDSKNMVQRHCQVRLRMDMRVVKLLLDQESSKDS